MTDGAGGTTVARPVGRPADAHGRSFAAAVHSGARAAWSHGWGAAAIAGLLSLVVFVIQTWPLLMHPGGYGIGAPGDGMGGSAIWQALVHEHLNPFAPGRIAAFNAPAGLPVTWQINIQQWPSTLIFYALTWLSGGNGEFAFTVYVALGMFLTAASMAWLAERLTHDRAVAVIVGLAVTIVPFVQIAAKGHPAFVHNWVIAATVGAVWALYDRPSPRRAALVGLLGFVAMSWSGYQLLFVVFAMAVTMAGFLLASLRKPVRNALVRDYAIVVGVMLAGGVAQYVAILALGHGGSPTGALRTFPRSALTTFGARWYEYLLPDSNSILFGADTRSFFATHLHGSNPSEATLYLGVSAGLLVLCGVVAAARGRLGPRARVPFFVCGALLCAAGLWASLPLYAGTGNLGLGIRLPTLAGTLGELTTNWRVFSRFLLVAMVGWFLMAAGGLAWLARGGLLRRGAVLILAAGVLAVDLYIPGELASFRLGSPQITAAIRRLPAGAIAQYPLVRGELDGYAALYNQPFYRRPVLNGFDEQPQEPLDAELHDLAQPHTVLNLSLLRVRYVLDIGEQLPGAAASGPPSPLLRKVAAGMYGPWPASVLEVPATLGSLAEAIPSAGFTPVEATGTTSWQWLAARQGSIQLVSHCATKCRGELRFLLATLGPEEHVTISDQAGRVLHRLTVTAPEAVSLPIDLSRTSALAMRADPGPIPVARVKKGSNDPRSLAVQLLNLRWVAAAPRR
jgi:hypothetical protein